jgi:D-3-phosphoglycerate dehydrogenase / 2-oxoglutarate reductase
MPTILLTAPYMLPFRDRFVPLLESYGLTVIEPSVRERMDEADLLEYAGLFDGTICGDDRYTERVMAACLPRLKVISKWGTGIDSIDSLFHDSGFARIANPLTKATNGVFNALFSRS